MTHIALSEAFGDVAMNKFGICFQCRSEHFSIVIFQLSIGEAIECAFGNSAKSVSPTLARAQQ
jgi:hypothetical protein